MNKAKFRVVFLSFFFFFQGICLTAIILFTIFDNKVIPSMKEKSIQIEMLMNELNKTKYRNYTQPGNSQKSDVQNRIFII